MAVKKLKKQLVKIRPKKKPLPSQIRAKGSVRKKQIPEYKSFRLHRKIKPQFIKKVPTSTTLFKESVIFFKNNWRPLGLFMLVFGTIYLLFVQGMKGGIGLADFKASIDDATGGSLGGFFTSLSLFQILLDTSTATSSDTAAIYQVVVLLIGSLSLIWMLRKMHGKDLKPVRVKDAFYKGMRPLVPFLLVMLVLLIELVPLLISMFAISAISSDQLTIGIAEQSAIIILAALLAVLSLYLISGSFASMYIVTLPDAEPLISLRSSKQLLMHHRWVVVRRIIILIIILVLIAALIFLPLLYFIPARLSVIIEYLFFFALMGAFIIGHTYLYKLYRSLL